MSAPRAGELLGQRYVLGEPLGEGASALVLRARDRWLGRDVALKLFAGADADELARREYAVAVDACHPVLSRALDVGRYRDRPFVVFELAEGEPFDRALRGADERTLARSLEELLGALAFLHGRGLLHGDLKPAHARVQLAAGRARVRLLDLGLARAPGEQAGGNTAYGAPEAFDGAATEASDLFGIGAMAHEAWTGALPFGDPDDPQYLSRLMSGRLVVADRALPASLEGWIRRMVATDPRVRFRDALDARAALQTLTGEGSDLPETPAAPPLVGRDGLLERARVYCGGSRSLVLTGLPEAGRSRLLARLAAEARLAGCSTIEVSAAAGLRALLVDLLEGAERLGAEGADAARERVLGDLSKDDHRYAALFAVLDVLGRLPRGQRLRVAIDDVDEADDVTAQAVRFLADGERGDPLGWLLVSAPGAFGMHAADVASSIVELPVEPLQIADVERLLSSMLVGLADVGSLAEQAHALAGGLPGRVVGGVERLARSAAVRFCQGGWQLAAERDLDEAFGELSDDATRRAIDALGAEEREPLMALALAGGDVEAAARRLSLSPRERKRAERAGLRVGLLREGGRQWAPGARQALESCLEALGERAERVRERLVHGLAAEPGAEAAAARARHLAALGRRRHAAQLAASTAKEAAAEGRAALSTALLSDAVRWGDEALRREIALPAAELLAARGALDDALQMLERGRAAGVAAGAEAACRGRVMARAGRYDEAIEAFASAAEARRSEGVAADEPADAKGLAAPAALEPEDRFWLGWSLMMRGRYEAAAELARCTDGADPRERARLGRLAGTIAWHLGDVEESCRRLYAARADAEAGRDPLVLAEVEQSLGTAERLRGQLDDAAARFREACRLSREHGFVSTLAKALNNLAINEYQAGRWEEAERAWRSMQELSGRLGALEEVLLSHNNLALLHRDRGELARAEASLEQALALSRQLGLGRYEAMVLGNLGDVRTLAGRLEEAAADLDRCEQLATAIDARSELLELAVRRAALALRSGDAEGALALAAEAIDASAGAPNERGNAALIACAAARDVGRLDEADARLATAREAFVEGGTHLEQARLRLEEAQLAAARGDGAQARRLARGAARVFADLGAERELAEARTLEDHDELLERGNALLDLVREANGALDLDGLLSRVVGRLLELTGAERGFVLLLEGERAPRIAAARGVDVDAAPVLSRGIADRVVTSGRALVLANIGEELELATRHSVMGMGLRAALCAPLMRGQRCLGLLYVDSRRGPELVRFGSWMVDAAAAILVPALERLIDAELDRERVALLRGSAVGSLETLACVDAALRLAGEEEDPERRRSWLLAGREHVRRATDRAEGLLELVRLGERQDQGDEEEPVGVDPLLRGALSGCGGDPSGRIELPDGPSFVQGGLEALASLLSRMVEVVRRQVDDPDLVRVRARPAGAAKGPGTASWRPGQTVGRRFLRIEVWVDRPPSRPELLEADASAEAIALRSARRLARQCGGRLLLDESEGRFALVAELLATTQEAA